MKKVLCALFSVLFVFSVPIAVFADSSYVETKEGNTYVEYYDDGSYTVTVFEENEISTITSTISKSKTATHYSSQDKKQWSVTLTGTFSYTGSSATCTNSKTFYQIFDSSWKVTSATASKSGRTAKGEFTIKQYLTGIPVRTEKSTLTISCSNSGVLS